MTISSNLPFIAVIIPFLFVFIVPFVDDEKGNRLTAAAAFLSFVVTLLMYPQIKAGNSVLTTLDTGLKITFLFRVDALGFIVGSISSIVWALASVFAVEYMRKEHAQKRYNIFSLLSFCGMIGVVFTGNLFTLYIFFELLSVASYVMVIHVETEDAKKAGLTYIFMGIGGGLILLFSIIATYAITGTGDLSKIGLGLQGHPALPFIFLGYILGFGVKAGLFPMHIWLPSAHPVAPAPGSALLSGVMIKAGAYGIIRATLSIVGAEGMKGQGIIMALLVFAFINIFMGSAVAIRQVEIKKMLAYSSISQIGYVILGVALLSPSGIVGGVVHIFNHAIIKGTLFLCAGAFIHQTGKRQLKDLHGIGKQMPVTTICFTLASLSMIGFPPFNGFISKWYLAIGALEVSKTGSFETGVGMMAMGMLLLSSFMNLVYYGPVLYKAWLGNSSDGAEGITNCPNADPNWWMIAPLLILGIGTVFFGIFPQLPVNLAQHVSNFYLP